MSAPLVPVLLATLLTPVSGDRGGLPDSRCAECHPRVVREMGPTFHGVVHASKALGGCDACHGPGETHARTMRPDDIVSFRAMSPEEVSAACARCHAPEMREFHRWEESELREAGKACTDCHAVHEPAAESPRAREPRRFETREDLARAAQPVGPSTCASCHPRQGARLAGSWHSVLAVGGEDARGCEACHGAGSIHAGTNGLRRAIVRPDAIHPGAIAGCRECHEDVDPQRFHWERPPLLGPGLVCAGCHRVHREREAGPAAGLWSEGLAPSGYAGDAACRVCHAAAFAILGDSNHAPRAWNAEDPRHGGCEACHGPGASHASRGGRARFEGGRAPASESCLGCHGEAEHFARWGESEHGRAQVSCLDCHPAAQAAFPGETPRAEERCQLCHADVLAEFRLPNRHRWHEGAIRCTDCHDPHGEIRTTMGQVLRRQTCGRCHAEKDGPFVFPHEADRVEGCLACHEPHGSPNRKMLLFADARALCLSCHRGIPSFHDQSPGSVWRRCVDCHQEVHGSNFDPRLYR